MRTPPSALHTRKLTSSVVSLPLRSTPKKAHAVIDPLDREGRAAAVAATFAAANAPLSELRHPTKAGVTAVEAFDILPDADLWANELDLVRFGEDPAKQGPVRSGCPDLSFALWRASSQRRLIERLAKSMQNELPRLGPDPRLPRAIMRDLSSEFPEGEGRVAYYLPSDDPNAIAYTEKRYAGEETGPEEVRRCARCTLLSLLPAKQSADCRAGLRSTQTFDFRWVRDYEIASTRPLNQEFIVSFDAGDEATEGERKARPATVGGRRKGAYYAPLGGAIQLRKRRPKVSRFCAPLETSLRACGRDGRQSAACWGSPKSTD